MKPLSTNDILQLSAMEISIIGLGLAWKWELIGGIIALAAFIALVVINPTVINPSLLYIVPITAILFIVLWAISRKNLTIQICSDNSFLYFIEKQLFC
jgi:hypothetical protein